MFKGSTLLSTLVLGIILCNALSISGGNVTEGVAPEPTNSPSPSPSSSTTEPTKPTTKTTPTTPTTKTTVTTPPTTKTTVTTTPSTTTPSTTPAPVTTPPTTKPTEPTTTAKPPQPTPPEPGTWDIPNASGNSSCVLVRMMAAVDVYYKMNNETPSTQINVPANATASGVCGKQEQNITLSWAYNATVNDSLQLVFKLNETKFDLETISLNLTIDENNNSTKLINATRTKEEFATPTTMSYKCKKPQLLNFTDPKTNETIAVLHITDVQFQAFGNITKRTFATAKDCEPYETPDIVPIAVGCALIALIVFVLIGYLVGRRRNQARGYLSM